MTRGAALVRARGIHSDAELGALVDVPLGPTDADRALHTRLRHMYEAGAWVLVESAIADLPADLRWLFESGAVTIEQLAVLHQALGVTAAADLADAVERQAVRTVPGLDAMVEYAVGAALFNLRSAVPRVPLGRAIAVAAPIIAELQAHTAIDRVSPAGSLRRGQETVGDIEIVAAAADPAPAAYDLARHPGVSRVLHRSDRRVYLLLERVQVGVRFPEPDVAGAVLLHLTGSAAHVSALRVIARERGLQLTAEGLRSATGEALAADTEEAIYRALGLPFVPPEIRNGDDEIAAARNGSLPHLIATSDVRGDLHMHTDYSDGRDSVDAMVAACAALGYEYIAISDHSPHSAASRNLTQDGVRRQADEIAAARNKYPAVQILHGCEVDILPDGRLDFPDRILERFDIVLASLHERAGQSGEQLLNRYIAAMRHPLVSVVTHPTNRLVPYRAGYELDYGRLIEVAVETGTALEIDGAPVHLDMDGPLARRAIASGATIVIDGDSHRSDVLERQMHLGVTMARRGWVEARHVLNTRPLGDVRVFVAKKRKS